MTKSTQQLSEVLKRKDCRLLHFVSLMSKKFKSTRQETKRLLFDLDLHKLETKEDESLGYKIELTDEKIIKNYLLNIDTYNKIFISKTPDLIKFDKAVLINWLRSKNLDIPSFWDKWIKEDYPLLVKHNLTSLLNAKIQDSSSPLFHKKESHEDRNKRLQEALNELKPLHSKIKTHKQLCEKLIEVHGKKYSLSSLQRWTKSPYK